MEGSLLDSRPTTHHRRGVPRFRWLPGVHLNLHGHECPPMLPPTPPFSDKLIMMLALLPPMLSLDISPCFVLAGLAAPGLQVASDRHTPPQVKGLRHRRLIGGTYATSAIIRPLVFCLDELI